MLLNSKSRELSRRQELIDSLQQRISLLESTPSAATGDSTTGTAKEEESAPSKGRKRVAKAASSSSVDAIRKKVKKGTSKATASKRHNKEEEEESEEEEEGVEEQRSGDESINRKRMIGDVGGELEDEEEKGRKGPDTRGRAPRALRERAKKSTDYPPSSSFLRARGDASIEVESAELDGLLKVHSQRVPPPPSPSSSSPTLFRTEDTCVERMPSRPLESDQSEPTSMKATNLAKNNQKTKKRTALERKFGSDSSSDGENCLNNYI